MSGTVYPSAIDSDAEIQQINDNLSEIGTDVINALRSAVFALEEEVGVGASGSMSSLAARLGVSLNPNGTIRSSALSSVGLATLPISDAQVASNSITEAKLQLDYSTSDLHSLYLANSSLLSALQSFANSLSNDFFFHLSGAVHLSDNTTLARHVLSQIDLNSVPTDSRDLGYVWTGLLDTAGVPRSVTQAAEALLVINNELVEHENATSEAHPATAITVNTSNFQEIPEEAANLQEVLDYLDDAEVLNLGEHRATQHAAGIPPIARAQSPLLPDGYRENVVPPSSATTYLMHSPNTTPVDNLSVGDDLIKFVPDNTDYIFDSQFSQVQPGDIVRVNYGNGLEASFIVDSIRYTPGAEWIVRINGINLFDSGDGYALARIDRARADENTSGILALAPVNVRNSLEPIYTDVLTSVIVGSPRGANALGLGFDPNQINSSHYYLYLELYPTGNPADRVISLPAIDVSGNAGATPGFYTLESIVQATNDSFRRIGYNYRFIAYAHNGQFGLMLADSINNASFAIIANSSTSGINYSHNVIYGDDIDNFDGLGLGSSKANVAGNPYRSSFVDTDDAQAITRVHLPLKKRNYIANGIRRDDFAPTYAAIDGYWDGYLSARTPIGLTNIEVTYSILLDLRPANLKPGKTLVIQPAVEFTDPSYNDVDYGRFVIKSVSFLGCPPGEVSQTDITVINGLHGAGTGYAFSSSPTLPVKIYFGEDSVGFDSQNIIDGGVTSTDYARSYEILVDQNGHTFSHERARLPKQSETTSLLRTVGWHLRKVSPKLRGFRDSSSSAFNKYVRLYILSYESSSGSFDGYLGQRAETGSGISHFGPVTTGRKNLPVRFYDETGVDYIELIYVENDTSPGVDVLSTALPRYADIELFPSFELQDEFLFLGTCEVNWDPNSQDIVQYVINSRSFGSVDATDFTPNALEFISASDRFIHQNGVFRGLDYSSTGSNGEIFFNGGVGLVNGVIVSANQGSVTIPQIYDYNGSALPQTVLWVVCLDQSGNFIPVILTTAEDQLFGTIGDDSYYVQSATLTELTNTRKDLLPLALVTAVIASITISDVSDLRKFIVSEDSLAPLVWSADNGVVGNFYDFEPLKNWLLYSDTNQNKVIIRGTFEIASDADPYDLTGLNTPTIFEGQGAVFNVAAPIGFLLGSNITLRDITFNYTGTVAFPSAASLLNSDGACLYCDSGSDIKNVKIENCTFTGTGTSQRPPFILFLLQKSQINSDIEIIRNKITETSLSGYVAESQAAIAFFSTNDGVGTQPAALSHVRIVGNICSHKQGVYLTVTSSPSATSPGLNAFQTTIAENTCGIIGILTSGVANTNFAHADRSTSLNIFNNTCNFIGSLYSTGEKLVDEGELAYGTGDLDISHNRTSWLALQVQDVSASGQYSETIVTRNTFHAGDPDYLTLFSPTLGNDAIIIFEASNTDSTEVLISENKIDFGYFDSTLWGYDRGIACFTSSQIFNNSIRGINASGTGINVASFSGSATRQIQVEGNKIYRGTTSIHRYISVPSTNTHNGIIQNNYFDSKTIDGSSVAVINNIPNGWSVHRNKNQTSLVIVASATGNTTISPNASLIPPQTGTLDSSIYISNSSTIQMNYDAGDTAVSYRWYIPIFDVLPEGCFLSSLSYTYTASVQDGSDTIQTVVVDGAGVSLTTTTETISTTAPTTVTYSFSPIGYIRYGAAGAAGSVPYIQFTTAVNNASNLNIKIADVTLTFNY